MIYYNPDDGTIVVERQVLKNREDVNKLIKDLEKQRLRVFGFSAQSLNTPNVKKKAQELGYKIPRCLCEDNYINIHCSLHGSEAE